MCASGSISSTEPTRNTTWSASPDQAWAFRQTPMRALIVSISFATLAVSTACAENCVTRYRTVQDAKNDRLFERGWVLGVLPDTAGPLTEAHDIDTSARCALVEFPPSTFDGVLAALSQNGFQRYDTAVPTPPLRACPFNAGDFDRASIVLRRMGATGDLEFVGVS